MAGGLSFFGRASNTPVLLGRCPPPACVVCAQSSAFRLAGAIALLHCARLGPHTRRRSSFEKLLCISPQRFLSTWQAEELMPGAPTPCIVKPNHCNGTSPGGCCPRIGPAGGTSCIPHMTPFRWDGWTSCTIKLGIAASAARETSACRANAFSSTSGVVISCQG